jgi:hypothetical protein
VLPLKTTHTIAVGLNEGDDFRVRLVELIEDEFAVLHVRHSKLAAGGGWLAAGGKRVVPETR